MTPLLEHRRCCRHLAAARVLMPSSRGGRSAGIHAGRTGRVRTQMVRATWLHIHSSADAKLDFFKQFIDCININIVIERTDNYPDNTVQVFTHRPALQLLLLPFDLFCMVHCNTCCFFNTCHCWSFLHYSRATLVDGRGSGGTKHGF